MGSKSSGIHSVRVPNELWLWLTEEAKRREVTPNGLLVDLLLVARLRADEARIAEAAPANPPKVSLQVGPAAAMPGSRLKKR